MEYRIIYTISLHWEVSVKEGILPTPNGWVKFREVAGIDRVERIPIGDPPFIWVDIYIYPAEDRAWVEVFLVKEDFDWEGLDGLEEDYIDVLIGNYVQELPLIWKYEWKPSKVKGWALSPSFGLPIPLQYFFSCERTTLSYVEGVYNLLLKE